MLTLGKDGAGRRVDCSIDSRLVAQEHGSDQLVVDDERPVCERIEAPDEESDFGQPVEGEPAQDQVREELEQTEERVHDPVREPLRVVVTAMRLQCMNPVVGMWADDQSLTQHQAYVRAISRIQEAHHVADQLRKVTQYHVQAEDCDQACSKKT